MQLWQFTRRIHTSWIIAVASSCVVIGVALVPSLGRPWFGSTTVLIGGATLLGIGLWRRNVFILPLVVMAGLLIGLWRGSVEASQLTVYKNIINTTVSI